MKYRARFKPIVAAAMLAGFLFNTVSAMADDTAKAPIGTWKLTSWTLQVVGESGAREPFGPNAKGRLVITPQNDFIVIITGNDRHAAKTVDEKAALLDSLLSYAGKSTIEGNKITTTIDISSNEVFTGANKTQVRFFEVKGDTLTIKTPEIASAALPGKKVVGTLTWERE
jgi:hypothetical protein